MIKNFESEFLAFCREKPATEKYQVAGPWNCALGLFVESKGFKGRAFGYSKIDHREIVEYYSDKIYEGAVRSDENTFGALVQRLEAAGVK